MIVKRFQKLQAQTTIATLRDVYVHSIVMKGMPTELFVLKTDVGDFSGLRVVWEYQNIDAEKLNVGDKLMITYVKRFYERTGRYYNNFTKVQLVCKSEPLAFDRKSPVDNRESNSSTESTKPAENNVSCIDIPNDHYKKMVDEVW